ncbi:DUF2599 domain-containing protein [Williamsia deligens]|uniref:DUF2599 domain-containing protein n=1 Tax=Williamsia deligens TaxID=321325 RepID=A0ABW3G2B1_9NOCA|nr:DUF2599 domain-containing protein [Williamsia deligens]MCP2194409.1 Protein of unknown function (DUF2599) [Williamsia deligens]
MVTTGVVAAVAVLAGCGADTSDTPAALSSAPSAPASTPAVITSSVPPAVPPFIDRVMWVQTSSGPSLQVYPTPSGRRANGDTDAAEAWREVLADDPGANTPGMQAQFDCHWTFARLVAPDKPSWNLEPWRPVVDQQQMVAARCNPGGPEI